MEKLAVFNIGKLAQITLLGAMVPSCTGGRASPGREVAPTAIVAAPVIAEAVSGVANPLGSAMGPGAETGRYLVAYHRVPAGYANTTSILDRNFATVLREQRVCVEAKGLAGSPLWSR